MKVSGDVENLIVKTHKNSAVCTYSCLCRFKCETTKLHILLVILTVIASCWRMSVTATSVTFAHTAHTLRNADAILTIILELGL